MRYYAYYRVSTETQVDNNGIEMQVFEIDKYCKANGITLAGAFKDEGVSGTREERDGLYDLLAVLDKGDRVVVQNTSRLWRDDNVKVFVHREMKRIQCDVVSIENPRYSIYKKDPQDKFFNAIMEALDEYDRDLIAMKLAKGRKARANGGCKPCGAAPYGYKWQGNEIVIDYNNHLVVKDIYEQFISLGSIGKVKKHCDAMGYKTARGNDFSIQSIKNILVNDFYIGVVTYAGKKTDGSHEPIISRDVFDLAETRMRRL